MSRFHSLRVQEVRSETADCVSIAFDLTPEQQSIFSFLPGQYLTLRTQLEGEEVRRSYSICTSPLDGELRVAIKKVPGGKFSTFANEALQTGDILEAMPPMGNFTTEVNSANQHLYVGVAAGSGITPVLSLVKTILEAEPASQFLLFYGNRHVDTIIFREEIEGLKNQFLDRFVVHHILSGEHYSTDMFAGRISSAKMKAFSSHLFDPKEVSAFFLCGPQPMIMDVKKVLKEQHVDSHKIHFELFTTAFPNHGHQKRRQETRKQQGVEATVELVMDGSRFRFQMEQGDRTVLDAAQQAGADVPFSCKGGVCSTCRAKVLSGEVQMDVNYALEADELEQGYVLTCQAHPITNQLVLDFDS